MNSESLLLAPDTRVTCPNCGQEFSLEQGFARQALETVVAASSQSLVAVREQERLAAERRAELQAGEQARAAQRQVEDLRRLLKDQSDAHARSMAELRALTERSFAPQLDALKAQLTESQSQLAAMDRREAALAAREQAIEARVAEAATARAAELLGAERQSFEKQLAEQAAQVRSLRAEQLTLREERQKISDEKDGLALEVQRQLDARLGEREAAVRAAEQHRTALEKAELQKKIDDMAAKLSEAQAKAAQGSQQLQGEVLELAIEEGLRRAFPLDVIEEVKKGVRGGDVIQRIVSRTGQAAGMLLWETKRARDWSPSWIAKLKEDMRACGAEMGVLVTMPGAVPREWLSGQQFGLHDEVWVTTWAPALQLAEALRTGLLDVHKQRLMSAGKGEKMEALYDYLTSPQFAQKLKAVYGTFQKMREELEQERSVTLQRWARREKQLQAGAAALLGVGGDIQGLAQLPLAQLELEERGPADEVAGRDP